MKNLSYDKPIMDMSLTLHAHMLPYTYLCYLPRTPLPMPLMPFKNYNYSVRV